MAKKDLLTSSTIINVSVHAVVYCVDWMGSKVGIDNPDFRVGVDNPDFRVGVDNPDLRVGGDTDYDRRHNPVPFVLIFYVEDEKGNLINLPKADIELKVHCSKGSKEVRNIGKQYWSSNTGGGYYEFKLSAFVNNHHLGIPYSVIVTVVEKKVNLRGKFTQNGHTTAKAVCFTPRFTSR